ncbi:MAG: hypothetical protein DI536_05940 [Archangium gephyra]|uniref:Uncharacterized protein n=1 Tax=Archangium gephyra TaxID=48 RepID=A0A2W5TZG6_9BACT|nr:MAG: hypothetical protein DI536_05940 [Archangium gephyra]
MSTRSPRASAATSRTSSNWSSCISTDSAVAPHMRGARSTSAILASTQVMTEWLMETVDHSTVSPSRSGLRFCVQRGGFA